MVNVYLYEYALDFIHINSHLKISTWVDYIGGYYYIGLHGDT